MKKRLFYEEIPVVDLFQASVSNPALIIGQAFHDIGFVFVKAPHIAQKLSRIYGSFGEFFNQPESVKRKYIRPDIHYQRGWTPSFTEIAIACRNIGTDGDDLADAKEGWFIGPDNPPDSLVKQFPGTYTPNIWPTETPSLKPAMQELYGDLFTIGQKVLSCLASHLGQRTDYFEDMLTDAPTVLRAIHYPPVTPEQVNKIVWACDHTDINLVTVLPASTRSGLRIRRRDGVWIPGHAPEGCVIVQVGDMLQYLTGTRLMSAVHKVEAPKHATTEGRLSAALFVHPRSNYLMRPLVDDSKRNLFPAKTANEMLLQRLKDIGLSQDSK